MFHVCEWVSNMLVRDGKNRRKDKSVHVIIQIFMMLQRVAGEAPAERKG